MTSRSVVIAEPVRTAIGAFGGTLKDVPAPDLSGVAIRAAVERACLKPEEVETVAMGNVIQAGTKMNPARQAAVQAGLPVTVPAMTVNRVCGSGAQAIAGTPFFGAAMAKIGDVAKAQEAGSGSYSNAAIALPDAEGAAKTREEQIRAVRIARAMRAGPRVIRENATIAEQGRITDILRRGTNDWSACPATKMPSAILPCVPTPWACNGSRICSKGSCSRPTRRRGFATCSAAPRSTAIRTPMIRRAPPYRLARTG
jgi:hypothetical protein